MLVSCRAGSKSVEGSKAGLKNGVFTDMLLRYPFMKQLSLRQVGEAVHSGKEAVQAGAKAIQAGTESV